MQEPLQKVELVPGPIPVGQDRMYPPDSRPQRLIVFLLTFVITLASGLYYNFQRPPVYVSSASLLTVAPPEVDQQVAQADLQHVAIQLKRLLSRPLLEEVIRRLEDGNTMTEHSELSIYRLQSMLSVVPVPETNLVEVQAKGPDAAFLPLLLNTLLNSYLDERAEEVRKVSAGTTDALRTQYAALGKKIVQKREELDSFRRDHQILSIGRDENQVVARLNGLTASLNSASEEEVKAKAHLDAIQAAVKRGEAVVPDQDKRTLAQMEARAQEMREQLAQLDSRYQRSFFKLDPNMEILPQQLERLERKIRKQHEKGRDIVTTSAQQEYIAARQSVLELRRQLQEHKQKVSEFTARFAEHEALQEDLVRLEELYRKTEERLVQIEVENRQKYPQVKVVGWAFQPDEPVSPLYLRDAGIALAAALGFALFLVWLVDFLRPKSRGESYGALNGAALYPSQGSSAIEHSRSIVRLSSDAVPVLERPGTRDLSPAEIEGLFEAADLATRQLLGLLLSGVSAEELMTIRDEDIDINSGEVNIQSDPPRIVKMPPSAVELYKTGEEAILLFKKEEGEVADLEELDARLQLAAADAGLRASEQINCQVLNHSYIVYLVRQGLRLSELEKIIGRRTPKFLAAYSRISPTGRGRPVEEISVFYPLPE